MNVIKKIFAVIILGMSLYYGYQAYILFKPRESKIESSWLTDIDEAYKKSEQLNKPVFIDFWASWCKNCHAMDKIVLKDPQVKDYLSSHFVLLKYQAENPEDVQTKKVLDAFGVVGLPTFIVLEKQ